MATTSDKGTVVRVFSVPNGQKVVQLRRGSYLAGIFSISFNCVSSLLAVSSDTNTVHIFRLVSCAQKSSSQEALGAGDRALSSKRRLSPRNTSLKRFCPRKTSQKRSCPRKTSQKRSCPRKNSPARFSPKRFSEGKTSLKRFSPQKTSLKIRFSQRKTSPKRFPPRKTSQG
ncbi:hypothetical protein PSTG_07574 [Puccinia striiformis f. sp. tritici PST-78]|uniref:Autophagy-related protein 18 n=1 Tax=Puccinia striiformis f. sp. tritici PST-78 TaxID=1165861 RepID=A0A0L0VJD0_9BASI|nr:hypothetical protein PSTG_07574 [Puccinia striiformis f. sp. tritici PST-78]